MASPEGRRKGNDHLNEKRRNMANNKLALKLIYCYWSISPIKRRKKSLGINYYKNNKQPIIKTKNKNENIRQHLNLQTK